MFDSAAGIYSSFSKKPYPSIDLVYGELVGTDILLPLPTQIQ
jgi:hypothetical protein